LTACSGNKIAQSYERESDKSLEVLLDDIEFEITQENLRIVHRLHIGEAIRTGGIEDFPDYEVIMYCSMTFAEKMLRIKPDMINTCPGRISVRGKNDIYIVSARLWPEDPRHNDELNRLFNEMNQTLIKIVDNSVLHWK